MAKSITLLAFITGVLLLASAVPRAMRAAAPAAYTESIPNTKVIFDMVPIAAGTFTMGSPSNEPGRGDDEGPAHQVALKAFHIGSKEVTWDEVMKRWKARGPKNEEFVGMVQRGKKEMLRLLEQRT